MIFKLKTSKETADIFEEIGRSTYLRPYTLVKHAIAWSLKEGLSVENFHSDSNGLELNRQTITGEYDTYFKVLSWNICKVNCSICLNFSWTASDIKASIIALIREV